jgi:hypothetical protein
MTTAREVELVMKGIEEMVRDRQEAERLAAERRIQVEKERAEDRGQGELA